jgi:hypothetical protein
LVETESVCVRIASEAPSDPSARGVADPSEVSEKVEEFTMTELLEFLKVYKDFGWVAVCFTIVYFFYKELKSRQVELVAITEKVTTALDKASNAIADMNETAEENKKSVNDMRHQNATFQAFLQGRDDNNRRTTQ